MTNLLLVTVELKYLDEICDKFGYFGVSLFTTLSTIDDFNIMKEEKFVKNIVDYFYSNFMEVE
jgi:hypothetical protein